MLENIYGVMHLYVACGMVALDILNITSELPPLCLIGTVADYFTCMSPSLKLVYDIWLILLVLIIGLW
jgi:hypothetical protein